MPVEFDDSSQFAVGATATKLDSSTGVMFRWSEVVAASMRAMGLMDSMHDGTNPPTNTDHLWLDKNSDPAVLKRWDPINLVWVQVDYDWFRSADISGMVEISTIAPTIRLSELGPGTSYRLTYSTGQGVHWLDQEDQSANPIFRWALGIEGDVMRLHRNGLGVGVTSGFPQAKLHVVGNSLLQGDVTVEGTLRHDRDVPVNGFLYVCFREDDNRRIDFHTSLDGVNFSRANIQHFQHEDGPVNGKDPSVCWFNNEWWFFVTNPAEGVRDFGAYKSDDLTEYRRFDPFLGTGVYSETVPMPGGNHPANSVWAPEPFIMNDTLYLLVSIIYGTNPGDDNFRLYYSECTDPDNMTFAPPVLADFGADNSLSMIDWSVIEEPDGTLYAAVAGPRDDNEIRIYSATQLQGPWAFETSFTTPDFGLEAPCWTKYYERDKDTGVVQIEYRIVVDNNRSHPINGTPAWHLIGRPYYWRSVSPTGPWVGPFPIETESSARHGSVVNLAEINDPRAARSVAHLSTYGKPSTIKDREYRLLTDGVDDLWPQQDFIYYIDGTQQVDLMLNNGPAERFFLGKFSADAAANITVNASGYVGQAFTIGAGSTDNVLIEMVRSPVGSYVPVGVV